MEITLKFVSGHSICHMVIKNDDQSVVKKDILNEDVANVFSGLSTTDEIYAVPQFLKSKTPDGYVDGLLYGCRGNNNISGIFFIPGGMQYMNFSGEEMVIPSIFKEGIKDIKRPGWMIHPGLFYQFFSNCIRCEAAYCFCRQITQPWGQRPPEPCQPRWWRTWQSS